MTILDIVADNVEPLLSYPLFINFSQPNQPKQLILSEHSTSSTISTLEGWDKEVHSTLQFYLLTQHIANYHKDAQDDFLALYEVILGLKGVEVGGVKIDSVGGYQLTGWMSGEGGQLACSLEVPIKYRHR